jgi:uncharacterized protein (DUF1697 family)
MSSVVFFRAVNVGGHQKFQPGKLAKELAEFGVVNIGAAGTSVVRENVSQTKLRDEILRRLPFKPELMICPAREVLALSRGNWFGAAPAGKGVGRFVRLMITNSVRTSGPVNKNFTARTVHDINMIFHFEVRLHPNSNSVFTATVALPAAGVRKRLPRGTSQ